MSEELKPCPKGCKNRMSPVFYNGSYWIKCSCGWQSPMADNHEDAVRQWNTRASGWISVKEEKPKGNCLVYLETPDEFGIQIHGASYSKGINVIGGLFDYCMPKVIKWMPLPK